MTDPERAADDAALVARIANGEEAAFVIAYDRHSGFIFGSTVRFIGDRDAAAEVVQDTFMALWRRAQQFDADSGSLLGWLLGIARHRAIDRMRAEGRRPSRDSVPLETVSGGRDGDAGSYDTDRRAELVAGTARTRSGWSIGAGSRQSFGRTVSELPEVERQVIELGYSARPLAGPDRRAPRVAARNGEVAHPPGHGPAPLATRERARPARRAGAARRRRRRPGRRDREHRRVLALDRPAIRWTDR